MKQDEWCALKRMLDKYKDQIECIFSAHIHGFQDYYLDGYHIFITGGGGAQIYKLEKDILKLHHAIRINLKNVKTSTFEIIPITK